MRNSKKWLGAERHFNRHNLYFKGGGGTTTVEKSDPWVYQQPYLAAGFKNAGDLYDRGPLQYYPGQTVADQSQYTQQAVDMTAQRALNGSPVESAAQSEATKTLNGDYLDPTKNPYLTAIADRNAGDITARVNSSFGAAGRTGSGINQQVLARELGDNANQLFGGAYQDERSRMGQTLALAPQTSGMDYTNLQQLGNAGYVSDNYAQSLIDANKSRWDFNQNAPWDLMNKYSSIIQGNNWGGTSQSSVDGVRSNPWLSTAGGAMTGWAAGASMGSGMGPYGAAAGALLGYLGSR